MTRQFRFRRELPVLILLLIPFAVLPFIWSSMPDQIPIHWGLSGEPDRFAGRTQGLLMIPAIGVAVYLLFWLIPAIDPKRRVSLQKKPLPALRFLLILVADFLFFVTIASSLGTEGVLGVRNLLHLGIILLFLLLGNYMPTIQPNYFIGIRTPWTLEDPEIWRRTHRLGGRIWVWASLGLLVLWAFLPQPIFSKVFLVVMLAVMVLVPVGYSMVLYFRRKRTGSEAE